MLPLRSAGRRNFDKGLHDLTTLIKKLHILTRTAVLYIYIKVSRTYFLTIYIYIYIYIYMVIPVLLSFYSFLESTIYIMYILIYLEKFFNVLKGLIFSWLTIEFYVSKNCEKRHLRIVNFLLQPQ